MLFFILNVSVVFFGKNYKFNNIKLSLISMNKITYLYGAGASRNALPICEEIPDRINNLINVLNSTDLLLDDKSPFCFYLKIDYTFSYIKKKFIPVFL